MCGVGEVNLPHSKQKLMNEKRATAYNLYQCGYSLREIMNHMGYKSVRSVSVLISQFKNKNK